MKNKGFTLIEILAVIVILGVIMVIAIPSISHLITKSKMNSLKVSADGIIRAAQLYQTSNENKDEVVKFTINNGEETSLDKLNYQGKIDSGTIMVYGENEIALCVTLDRFTAIKNVNENEITIKEGTCLFNEETQAFESKEYCGDYADDIDNLNQQISDLNTQVLTQKTAYESQIETLNSEIATLKSQGTATTDDILLGKTAYVYGSLITGTMSQKELKVITLGTNSQDTKATIYLTYNVSSYPNYQNFTINNFFVDIVFLNIEGNSGITNRYNGGITKTYNATTGIITITKPAINHPSGWYISNMQVDVKLAYVG